MFISFHACEKENNDRKGTSKPYDPDQPFNLDIFDPLEGGRATQLMLTADNLGNDPKILEVYFDDRRAPVIGCNHGRALIVVPRLPSTGEYTVTVKIGNKTEEFREKFNYTVRALVSTVCGNPNSGNNAYREGDFGLCVLRSPAYLTCDIDGNLFLAHHTQNVVARINEEEGYVMTLANVSNLPNAPTTDITGRLILVPADGGTSEEGKWKDRFWEFDPDAGWGVKERVILQPSNPTQEEREQGLKQSFLLNNFKHSFAICALDDKIYYRSNIDGAIIRFHPRSRDGERATTLEPVVSIGIDEDGAEIIISRHEPLFMLPGIQADGYLVFDPFHPHMLYAALGGTRHSIIAYLNILTGENGIYAGGLGEDNRGWRDGPAASAKFDAPRQMVIDNDGNFIVADAGNHCIRKIDVKTKMVTTVVGIAGKSGYQDGNPDDALFNNPWGVCIDRRGDGTIYVADRDNRCIRKLTIE